MQRPEVLTIAILAESMAHYHRAIGQTLPDLEKHHKVRFIKNHANQTYKAEGFFVMPVLKAKDVLGLRNYQLIKYGKYYMNDDSDMIIEHWEKDNALYKSKSPTNDEVAEKVKE